MLYVISFSQTLLDGSAFVGTPSTNFEWIMPIAMGHSLCTGC